MDKKRCVQKAHTLHSGVWDGQPVDGVTVHPDGSGSFAGCKGNVNVSPGDVIVFAAGGLVPCSAMSQDQYKKRYLDLE